MLLLCYAVTELKFFAGYLSYREGLHGQDVVPFICHSMVEVINIGVVIQAALIGISRAAAYAHKQCGQCRSAGGFVFPAVLPCF